MSSSPPGSPSDPRPFHAPSFRSSSRSPLRAIVVDDHPRFADFLVGLLDDSDEVEVVCRCTGGEEALERFAQVQPEVVFLDLEMPGMSGLDVLSRLTAASQTPKVVMVTLHDSPEYREACLAEGASAFVAKERLLDELPAVLARLSTDHQH